MGYNATVVVLLDRLHEIERDPEFGKKLADAIKMHNYPREKPFVTGQTQVVDVQHADTLQIVAVGANSGRVLGYSHWSMDDDAVLGQLTSERKIKRQIERARKKVAKP